MDTYAMTQLSDLNARFYAQNAASFSSTREVPWKGWQKVMDLAGTPASVLDLASGNLRFQKYVNARCPHIRVEHYCVDSCDALVDSAVDVSYQHLDMLDLLIAGGNLADAIEAPRCALCTTFGFMHHVPGRENRLAVLQALVEKAEMGGIVAVSFWQFARNEKLHDKAKRTTESALRDFGFALEENDYILGWNNMEGAYRYCHSFTEGEIDSLAAELAGSAELISSFLSDGKTCDLNRYLVFRRQ